MQIVLVYGAALLLAVLISEWSRRTVLSSAVLFLTIGVVAGPAVTGFVRVDPGTDLVSGAIDFALFVILFTDGLQLRVAELRGHWRLPVRALVLAMPATAALIAAAAHLVAAWFGPRGFASLLYALLVLRSDAPATLFEAAVVVVLVSIVLHSSTDVPVAHWFAGDRSAHERRRERRVAPNAHGRPSSSARHPVPRGGARGVEDHLCPN